MQNEDFVTYEQAVELKELGFDWECYKKYGIKPMSFGINVTWYKTEWTDYPEGYLFDKEYTGHREEDFILAPTLYQCQKWLREVKEILILIQHNKNFYWTISTNESDDEIIAIYEYETYEKALLGAINKALEIIKNN